MSLGPPKSPQRTPPVPSDGPAPRARVLPARQVPRLPGNLPTDALTLQVQLDRMEQHFEQLQAQLRQSQKLASIGTTAAMLAHEFNNLFTPVLAYAQHALDTQDTEMMNKALTKTLERVGTMRDMCDRLIGLAKPPDGAIKGINLIALARSAVGCLGRELDKDSITLNLQIDPNLNVRANENQLLQVLFNLVINARQAMLPKPGRLTIDAAPTGDGQVAVNIRDTGCGITEANLGCIFDPFFSTKQRADRPDQRGLGLGLTICRDIIEELGGQIAVASELGAGTTFTLTLPMAD